MIRRRTFPYLDGTSLPRDPFLATRVLLTSFSLQGEEGYVKVFLPLPDNINGRY
jgi:hypothetical protein